ncbi:MAG: UpxY family transcription antiterminator [Bacteroidales bacterium]|nr:UpxY family transcription antiterminator [Bacteroidales bacterium]
MNDNRRWYALYTRPRFEAKTLDSLLKLGFEAYLPTYKTLRQWSDRKKMVTLPLFPSYCFVRIRPEEYYKPLAAYGVVRHIKFENVPVPLPDSDIETMRIICEGKMNFEVTKAVFEPGTPVIINQGSLKGLNGEFVRNSGKRKFLIRINAINHGILVEINPNFVDSIPTKNQKS